MGKKLLKFYEENSNFILPQSRKNEVVSFVKRGLKDLSVSRTSFTWGIKVPKNEKHVIYVWLDALTNYLSALNFPDEQNKLYKDFWPASVHIIGKDILRFHAVYWPAFLMAAGLKCPQRVFGHGWILSDDKKMSKSIGNILDPLEIIDKFGIDQLRYYLIKEVSLGNDGNISMYNLKNCINNDLANNYGNLCQRVLTFVEKNCDNEIPRPEALNEKDKKLIKRLKDEVKNMIDLINRQDLNTYVKKVVEFSFESNKYFNDSEPWKVVKSDPKRMQSIIYTILEQIKNISILLNPIIPFATNKILYALNIEEKEISLKTISNEKIFKYNKKLKKPGILFRKIENDN